GRVVVPRDRNVPTRVRQAVLRGLAVAPEARFPSMDALLAELAPRRTSVVLGLGGFTIVAAAAMAMIALTPDEGAAVCQGAPGEVARVWNAQRRDNVQRAFAASGARDASGTFAVVERGLDAYFARWVTMHGEACEATHKFKQQSQAALDLRTACLGRKRAEVDALVEVLAQADAGVVQHVRQAIASLPSLDDCIDVQRAPEPADPALVAKLDRARALVDVARYSEAIALLDPMATASAPAKFPVLAADVEHVRAKALAMLGKYVEAEEALFRGLAHAQGARADAQIAVISVDLANVIGYRGQRTADGLRWIELARAAISAKGGDELLGARLETVHASILSRAGKRAEAEAANRAALAIVQRRAPNTALEAEVHGALGISLAARGKFVEAAVELERSLVLTEQHYGTQHALTANGHANLANALRSSGRVDEALAHYRTALEVNEAVFGKAGVQVATVLSNLGQTMQERGALRDAREYLERALAIRERALGADDPQVARTAANLGYLLLDEKSYEAALAMFTRVGQILEKRIGTDNPARSDDLAGVGLAYLGLGKSVEAIAPLTRAAELGGDGDPLNLASIHAALARALYTSGRDRARATTLARTARAALADAGEQAAVADIDRWLR
ncbi:MAG TPA: tetratricopeptide repeat protein, partial [Kofleriaceae bacterium]|nr:tetratricopeptide repeat protein [Kofleriaceae bacterium]